MKATLKTTSRQSRLKNEPPVRFYHTTDRPKGKGDFCPLRRLFRTLPLWYNPSERRWLAFEHH